MDGRLERQRAAGVVAIAGLAGTQFDGGIHVQRMRSLKTAQAILDSALHGVSKTRNSSMSVGRLGQAWCFLSVAPRCPDTLSRVHDWRTCFEPLRMLRTIPFTKTSSRKPVQTNCDVPVFDVGSAEQFPCFVVSKYIDGLDLGKRLRQSRLSLSEGIELIVTVAEALDYAHKNSVVHRDINIFRDQRPEQTGERNLATSLLADYAADNPQILADLLMDADDRQFARIFPRLKECGEAGWRLLTTEIDKKKTKTSRRLNGCRSRCSFACGCALRGNPDA